MRLNNKIAGLITGLTGIALSGQAVAETIGAPKPWQMGFQPSATEIMEQTAWFHNDILIPITFGIAGFVFLLVAYVMIRFRASANPEPNPFSHNTIIEVAWTLVPAVIVFVIAIISVRQIQFQDTPPAEAEITLKATGYQWYWEHEYVDEGFSFESLMIADEDLEEGQLRLLETDTVVVLPVDTIIRLLVTASPTDVIHAWAIPAFGIKVDAVPGRLNERWFRVKTGFEGRYYGQCSELCGRNHSYMPISIDIVSKEAYAAWLVGARQEYAAAGNPIKSSATTIAELNSANQAE